ncbi:hypothetical protein GS399_18895 [Pedobacter sp. HMF7647]|uniref:Uncharacterized protein n=1 Tax=Hufsiella arboris TaxID=2695275 RepID=A0A7K1YEL0_9SPHI|nr:hypothetical protein [Hufsiella arboris]MXV53043.1 hypothetical protein [Hufsiella arboris]
MLTFEEFFRKKKIDLVQLEAAERVLYDEFKSEYAQMGEKSFDHTKKFWFNKLRLSYHLKEEPKPAKILIQRNELAQQAEPLESPTIDQTANKKEEPETQGKPAFKPRFKPGMTNAQSPPAEENVTETEKTAKPVGFTPRFKIKPADTIQEPIAKPASDEQPATSKPTGFTPRFKAALKTEEQERLPPTEIDRNTSERDETPVDSVTEQEKNTDPGSEPAESPKPSYKPKFNMKNIKPKEEADQDQTPEADNLKSETGTDVPPSEATTEESKPAYNPRFNMKNIKPKQEE